MAEMGKVVAAKKARKKRGRAKSGVERVAGSGVSVSGERVEREESGAVLLKRAAASLVKKNSRKIANALLKKALAGDLGSAKMLVGLAESDKPVRAALALSEAMELVMDEPWVDPDEGKLRIGDPAYFRRVGSEYLETEELREEMVE